MQIQIGTRPARRRAAEIPEARRNNFSPENAAAQYSSARQLSHRS